ncbi:hypothetical protein B9Z19DRAFT_1193820 [Tuber borchii]|uniref:Uncharacterized protein n=1 Tax=Tuber borchii TaxID=42251 RepID=A0A2T6ZQG2_TUBBO|nr:hypothetical protein B9Z19DRAFT_1193820 [Tuber borchii]
MSAEDILPQVELAIKTGYPELFVRDVLDQEQFEYILKSLRRRTNYLNRDSIRIHWLSSEKRLKVVMPSRMHVCVAAWLLKNIFRAIRLKLLSKDWDHTMDIMTGTEHQNFVGRHVGSFKEPDMAFLPFAGPGRKKYAAFPSVVLESGWNESIARHEEDARVWQEGSGNAVRVMLQAKFHEPDN